MSLNEEIRKALESMREDEPKKDEPRVCRFCCSRQCRALIHNGILGPGYRVSEWVCVTCGRIQ